MYKITTSFLLVFIASVSLSYSGEIAAPSLSDKEISQLNELANKIDQGATEKTLLLYKQESSYPIRAMSTAILYRLNQKEHQKALYAEFLVNDHRARSKGIYHFVSPEEPVAVLKLIEDRYPQITDKRIQLLLAFSAYRNSNMWISTTKAGNISLSRFFRSSFLASVFKGTGLDAADISNTIDLNTQRHN